MPYELVRHLFNDAADIENTDTGEIITVPIEEYRYLARTLTDQQIYELVCDVQETEAMRCLMQGKV